MTIPDIFGLSLSGASADSLLCYQKAVGELQCFVGDPVRSLDAAIERAPGFAMAHIFKGYVYALSTEPAMMTAARECLLAATIKSLTGRERGHLAALTHLTGGRWHKAGSVLEEVSRAHPRDTLALQVGHQIDYFTGNSASLRDRIARAMPHWDVEMPGYHSTLGMHAFGLEENGSYLAAETAGRQANGLEPRNGWAQHAVAHVMEMQSRQQDGIDWMTSNPSAWSTDSFLRTHNWWHLALFHYDLGDTAAILDLYDGPIYGEQSKTVLTMIDASATLWRLHLAGVDVGERWRVLADNWLPFAAAGNYAFNDMHAMMAFVGAGYDEAAAQLLATQSHVMHGDGDNAAFTRDVGQPVARAIEAFGRGDYAKAVRLLAPVRSIAVRIGGSHAQRDVIELTLIEAALRAGDRVFASRLTMERHRARPSSPLSALFLSRAQALPAAG